MRVAIVTGAAQGIGRSIALRLAADGLAVGVNDISSQLEELNKLVAEITSCGGQALAIRADVSKELEVIEMVQAVSEAFGGLDVMVANAGIRLPGRPLLEMPEEDFDKVMSVNCKGTLYCYRAAAKQMIKQGTERGGRIIGASSMFGLTVHAGRTPYSTSKFAIRAITQTAALEWGQYGITVNCYAPGPIDTPLATSTGQAFIQKMIEQVPLKRMGQPEEVAALVSFIASPEASYITGQTLSINGGQIPS
ncbi:3-ketoacyl-(acyl-carrier) reductase [Rhizoctonia solani AG-3 Rhs1AP]|uniref:3-ketoacyl-(Acyl-carrier) reductase n=1 Tax=Rhizoctonia solani AG-3 Rhs1AP TaxID=1086054 RepID=X8IY85_9AGAM|nr:3-ketoacyl-(acyl-carrier) reductase [Rhizoctonia solani AG-3 Rhs1AP]